MVEPNTEVAERPAIVRSLGSLLLVGAVLQIGAVVVLGLAPFDLLLAAATEGSAAYVIGTLAAAAGATTTYLLRHRPLIAASTLALVVLSIAGATLALPTPPNWIGLVFHGERVLHHFLALVSMVVCVLVPASWSRAPISVRWPAFLLGAPAALLVFAHVQETAGTKHVEVAAVGTAAALVGVLAVVVVLRNRLQPKAFVFVVYALLVTLLTRIVLAGPLGFAGAAVPHERTFVLGTCIVITATTSFALVRPHDGPRLAGLVTLLCAVTAGLLHLVYRRGFGELEDGLGGLLLSLFGFNLPYPDYVAAWKAWPMSIAVFFMLAAIDRAIVSPSHRSIGVGLAIIALAGLGLRSPQLVLMLEAGFVVLFTALLEAPIPARAQSSDPGPVLEQLTLLAAKLELSAPFMVERAGRPVAVSQGHLGRTAIDVRVRATRDGEWHLRAEVGLLGKGSPELRIDPVARGHGLPRITGTRGARERLASEVVDALADLPHARVRIWAAGAELELLVAATDELDGNRVATLLQSLAAHIAGR